MFGGNNLGGERMRKKLQTLERFGCGVPSKDQVQENNNIYSIAKEHLEDTLFILAAEKGDTTRIISTKIRAPYNIVRNAFIRLDRKGVVRAERSSKGMIVVSLSSEAKLIAFEFFEILEKIHNLSYGAKP